VREGNSKLQNDPCQALCQGIVQLASYTLALHGERQLLNVCVRGFQLQVRRFECAMQTGKPGEEDKE